MSGPTHAPLISVVLPTYNHGAFLPHAVRSVQRQSHPRWEMVVVDDGSTDRTRGWLTELDDPRVRVVTQEHTGSPARARNAGIERATGTYIAFLDADDTWDTRKLELQLAALARHPECRWAFAVFDEIDERGRPVEGSVPSPVADPEPHWALLALVTMETVILPSTVLVERQLLIDAGAFDESLVVAEDYDLWFRLAQRSPTMAPPMPLVHLRRHPNRMRHGHPRGTSDWLEVLHRLMGSTEDPAVLAACRRRCSYSLLHLARVHRSSGRYGAALRALRSAWAYDPPIAAWAAAALGTALHALLPRGAVRTLRPSRE